MLFQPVRQLHKQRVVFEPAVAATRFETEQVGELVLVGVVAHLNREAAGQLVEQDGLVHVIPAPGNVGPPACASASRRSSVRALNAYSFMGGRRRKISGALAGRAPAASRGGASRLSPRGEKLPPKWLLESSQ